jgi:CBS domain containing-hemolysin-like protein
VGGLVFHLTGRIPSSGEVVTAGNVRITVLDADERRVIRLRIERLGDNGGEA